MWISITQDNVAAFSVGTRGIVVGDESIMFPELTCAMTSDADQPFCRVFNSAQYERVRKLIGLPVKRDKTIATVLDAFPFQPVPILTQPSLVCP